MSWKNTATYDRKEVGRKRLSGKGRLGLDNGRANASLRGDIQLRAKNYTNIHSAEGLKKAYLLARKNNDKAAARIINEKMEKMRLRKTDKNEKKINQIRELKGWKKSISHSKKELATRRRNNWYEGNQKKWLNMENSIANEKRSALGMKSKRYKKYKNESGFNY